MIMELVQSGKPGSQPNDTSEWRIQLVDDNSSKPIKNNSNVNFINPKTNSVLATCNWKVVDEKFRYCKYIR